MPFFLAQTIGTGADAEGDQVRPVTALYGGDWYAASNAPGQMLVRCAHQAAFDSDLRIRPMSRALLAEFAPAESETDDWDAPDLALKIVRRMLLQQKLGALDPGTNLAAKIARAQLDKIRAALQTLGYKTDSLTNNMLVGDLVLSALPQISARTESGAQSPGGTFTDDFNGEVSTVDLALHTPSGGTAWTRVDGTANHGQVSSSTNRLINNTTASVGTLYQCDDQGNANHYSQYVVQGSIAAFVCHRATNNSNYIGYRSFTGSAQIFRREAGTLTELASAGSVAIGSVLRMESSGDTHEVFDDGVSAAGPVNDSFNNTVTRQGVNARTSGAAGWADDYEAGTLSAGTTDAAFDQDGAALLIMSGASTATADLDSDAAALLIASGAATATADLDSDASALLAAEGASVATADLDSDAAALFIAEGADGAGPSPVAATFDMDAAGTLGAVGVGRVPQKPFTDNFDGESASVDIAAHLPSGGAIWVRVGGSQEMGQVRSDGLAYINTSSSTGAAYLCDDQESADQYISHEVENTNVTAFVCNRITDANNFIGVRAFGGEINLYKRESGSFLLLGSSAGISVGDVIRLVSVGDTHKVYRNGEIKIEATESFNNSVTRQGLVARSAGLNVAWLDNFEAGAVTVEAGDFSADATALANFIAPAADGGDLDLILLGGHRSNAWKTKAATKRREEIADEEALIEFVKEAYYGYYG